MNIYQTVVLEIKQTLLLSDCQQRNSKTEYKRSLSR